MILPPQAPPIIREGPPRWQCVNGVLVPIIRTDRHFREVQPDPQPAVERQHDDSTQQ